MMTSAKLRVWHLPKLTVDISVSRLVVVIAVIVAANISFTPNFVEGTSDFYYDHWQCNNYLSGQTVVVPNGPGKLIELHIRDNIPVSCD